MSSSPFVTTRNIEKEIKRSLSFLFKFESDFKPKETAESTNKLNIPKSFKNINKKSNSVQKLVLDSLKESTKDLFEQKPPVQKND